MDEIRRQLKEIIVSGLRITDRTAAGLRDDQPLMGGDIEIDSVDVLQLILDIERHFGIKLVTGEFDGEAWKTIDTLAATIQAKLRN